MCFKMCRTRIEMCCFKMCMTRINLCFKMCVRTIKFFFKMYDKNQRFMDNCNQSYDSMSEMATLNNFKFVTRDR